MGIWEIATGLAILTVGLLLIGSLGWGRKFARGLSLFAGLLLLAYSVWVYDAQLPSSAATKFAYDAVSDSTELGVAAYVQTVGYEQFVTTAKGSALFSAASGIWLIALSWWLRPAQKDSKIPIDRPVSSR